MSNDPLPVARRLPPSRRRVAGISAIGVCCVAALVAALLGQAAARAEHAALTTAATLGQALAEQVIRAGTSDPVRWDIAAILSHVEQVHSVSGRRLSVALPDLVVVADVDRGRIGRSLQDEAAEVSRQVLRDGLLRTLPGSTASPEAPLRQVVVPLLEQGRALGLLLVDYSDLLAQSRSEGLRELQGLAAAAFGVAALIALAAAVHGSWPLVKAVARPPGGRVAQALVTADRTGVARAADETASHADLPATEVWPDGPSPLAQNLARSAEDLKQCHARLKDEIARRELVERQLQRMSTVDPLTCLPNREVFIQQLERALARARRSGRKVALILIDLDRFKSINDTLGHECGDAVLRKSADRLCSLLRESDLVCRIGSDEFAVVLDELDTDDGVATVAEKLVNGFHRPLVMAGGEQIHVTLSLGIAVAPDDGSGVADLMKRADFAMHYTQADGRDGWRLHSLQMSEQVSHRLAIGGALRHAIERDELRLEYQPRVDSDSQCLVGMEALLRWHSGVVGVVSPDEFIPVAEETGMIVEIGAWVLRTACAQMAQWRLDGLDPGVLAVNISARQLRARDFITQVLGAATAADLPPHCIELELTESMLVEDPQGAAQTLSALRAHGFGIAIDDFGKGHSCLMHLKHLPATKLKIDRAFVTEIDRSPSDAAIAASIVALGKALSIRVTAEGVETRRQLEVLDTLGCHEYQGYFFGRPLALEQMQALLAEPRLRAGPLFSSHPGSGERPAA